MARDTYAVTDEWQQIGAGVCTFTVQTNGSGGLLFNTSATDTDAYACTPPLNRQFLQNETVDTFVRAINADAGYEILADGVLP